MKDRTYCINKDCKRKSCEKHLCHVKGRKGMVSVADFSGVCRKYVADLVREKVE